MRFLQAAAAAALVGLLLACATSVDVDFDPREDFTRYRTWSYGRVSGADVRPRALQKPLAAALAAQLDERGLRRSDASPSFLVSYRLHVERRVVEVDETPAESFVPSFHGPSFAVQATQTTQHTVDIARLTVTLSDARRRPIWSGRLESRVRDDFAPHLGDAVSRLLRDLPLGAP